MNLSSKLSVLDKLGAAGAVLAAAAAPCCFPLLGAAGAALGLGALQSYRGYMGYVIQAFVLVSAAGNVFAFRGHRQVWPLGIALASTAAVFYAYYISYQTALVSAGLIGLALAAGWNLVAKRASKSCRRPIELQSTVTCPHCGHRKQETMPTDACVVVYECQSCHASLRPKPGDCCVFCSYGSVKCPPIQSGAGCCST